MLADFSEGEVQELRELMVSTGNEMSKAHPGKLTGVSIVGWGKK